MNSQKNVSQSVAIQGLALFALPLIEIFLIRWSWHEILGRNIFALGFHQSDVLPGIAVGTAVLFWLYHRSGAFQPQPQTNGMLLHAAIVALFTLHLSLFDPFTVLVGARASSLLLLLFFAVTLLSSLLVWVPLTEWKWRFTVNKRPTLAVLIGIFILAIYPYVITYYWRFLARSVGICVYHALTFLGLDVKYSMGTTLFLQHRVLTARFMQPCSGLEGIFLFLFAFTVVWGFDNGRLSWKQRIATYVCGVLLMFSLNIARVVAFFAFSVALSRSSLDRRPEEMLRTLFHSGVGIVFYLVGISLFLYLVYRPGRAPVTAAARPEIP